MMYTNQYSNDDLYDMFANQADFIRLAQQPLKDISSNLKELAPDMEDADEVAKIIKTKAEENARSQHKQYRGT